ncbi:MAG: peptidoglycan/LPS O-acetylase OafA/YrhL, partial [Bermanella sp.]
MSAARLTSIEILRGIAALLVVWQHSSETFVRSPEIALHGTFLADIASSVDFGRIGVVCFFLISGFVIPFSFSSGSEFIKKFAIRRFFRLYPVYWFSIALSILLTYALSGEVVNTATILANLTMIQTFLQEPHIQGLYWTLQIEVIFYLICACMHQCGLLNKSIFQLVGCIFFLGIFCILGIAEKYIPQFGQLNKELHYIPYVLSIMFSGTILRTILTTQRSKRDLSILLLGPLSVFGIPLLVLLGHSLGINIIGSPVRFGFGHLFGLALFVVGFYQLTTTRASLIWFGTTSYSIYLFHSFAIMFVGWMRTQEWASALVSTHLSIYMLLVFLITLVVVFFTYNIV